MNKKTILLAVTVLTMLIAAFDSASAQTAVEPAPCPGNMVTGTLVRFDETTGTAVLLTEAGECTVKVGGDYTHPIVKLFDTYFGTIDSSQLAQKLESLQGWALQDSVTGVWTWADESASGAVPVQVTAVTANSDGTFTLTLTNELGESLTMTTSDAALAEKLTQGLAGAQVVWDLITGPDGTPLVEDIGEQIAAYHDDGVGFGVLAKLMSIVRQSQEACMNEDQPDSAGACDVTLAALVELKQGNTGMGQIFKDYFKPSILGVGHIRQEVKADETTGTPAAASAAPGKAGKPDKADKNNKSHTSNESKGNNGGKKK